MATEQTWKLRQPNKAPDELQWYFLFEPGLAPHLLAEPFGTPRLSCSVRAMGFYGLLFLGASVQEGHLQGPSAQGCGSTAHVSNSPDKPF